MYTKTITAGQSLAATTTTTPYVLQRGEGITVHVSASGTPTGTFTVEATNDPSQTSWVDVTASGTTSGTAAPAGAAADCIFNLQNMYAAIRVKYTRTSGTGTFSAWITVKG